MISQALPSQWIDRIFDRFVGLYGNKFIDMWARTKPIAEIKKCWGVELYGLTAQQIKSGLEACKLHDQPPTLPQFLKMCKPMLEHSDSDAFYRRIELAEKQWAERKNMVTDSCSKEKSMEKLEEIRKLMGMRNKVD